LIEEEVALREGLLEVAKLMAISAKTAPKAKGIDNVVIKIIDKPEEIEKLARKMEELSEKYGKFFLRDADNIRNSPVVVLIGCKYIEMKLINPERYKVHVDIVCSLLNLGIAIGSAVKTASIHNVDNRIMYSAGLAAQELGLIDADVVMAIPLSATGKNIYFDRKPKK